MNRDRRASELSDPLVTWFHISSRKTYRYNRPGKTFHNTYSEKSRREWVDTGRGSKIFPPLSLSLSLSSFISRVPISPVASERLVSQFQFPGINNRTAVIWSRLKSLAGHSTLVGFCSTFGTALLESTTPRGTTRL